MSVKAVEEAAPQISTDEFHALEEKIYRTIEQLKAAREARSAAERNAARLREQLEDREEQLQAFRGDMVALRREREEIRTRIEKMLKQIDALNQTETEA